MNKNIKKVEKSIIFGNWVDRFGYPLTRKILPFISKIDFITPNFVTFFSFFLYFLSVFFIFLKPPFYNFISSFFLILAYIGDQLDGQLARYKKMISTTGDYFDKTLDVLKVFLLMFFISLSLYFQTYNYIYIILGFIACFFFNFRYYIKLEVVLKKASEDKNYLEKSSKMMDYFEKKIIEEYKCLQKKGLIGKIKSFFYSNLSLFFIDEGEFVFFTIIGLIFNILHIIIWIFAISQTIIAFFRLFQRIYQLNKNSIELLKFLRK